MRTWKSRWRTPSPMYGLFATRSKKSDHVFTVGTQRRSSPVFQKDFEFISFPKFGDIVAMEMMWNVNQPCGWRRPKLVPQLREADIDWKRYLINYLYEPFDARKYLEFRLFSPLSRAFRANGRCTRFILCTGFSGLPRPRSVVTSGGIYEWRDGRQNWDTLMAVFDYGPSKDFRVVYSSQMTNSFGGIKELYFSNRGHGGFGQKLNLCRRWPYGGRRGWDGYESQPACESR
jgi:hypothetical protein